MPTNDPQGILGNMKEIVQDGAEVLRDIALERPRRTLRDARLARIVTDMKDALDPEIEGVAIAAPQIGIPLPHLRRT